MALLTRCRESASDVIRILRTVEIFLMAANASTGGALELPSHVARIAIEACMRSH